MSLGKNAHGKCPVLGDGITVCTGAVIVGNIYVADGTMIGANAVVSSSITENNRLVAGVPAKVIKENEGFSMQKYWETIENK